MEVALDDGGNVTSVTVVDDAQLAREQAEKALSLASTKGRHYFNILVAKAGYAVLIATMLLAVAWFFLPTISVQISSTYKASASFYDILKLVNSDRSLDSLGSLKDASAGFYGFFLYLVLLAPIISHFINHQKACLLYCAPLVYLLVVFGLVYFQIRQQIAEAKSAIAGIGGSSKMMEDMIAQIVSMTMNAISLRLGFYLSLAVAGYLCIVGVKKCLVVGARV